MHSVNEEHVLTLRERKARETQLGIERATLELALENGLANVTIEHIAERADISSRTFFNYFASKEDAVMGYSLRDKEVDILENYPKHPTAAGTYGDLRAFIIQLLGGQMAKDHMLAERMEVLTDNPHVMRRLLGYLEQQISKLTELVANSLATEAGEAVTKQHEVAAEMLVHLGGTAVGYAMERWRKDAGGPNPEQDITDAFELLERITATHVHYPQEK